MASAAEIKSFIEKVAPAAQKVASSLGISIVSFAIAQFCYESAYGTSNLAKRQNNLGGVKGNGPGGYAAYSSMEDFVQNGYYGGTVLGTLLKEKKPTSIDQYAQIFKESGYCPDAGYVEAIKSIIKAQNLEQYDGASATSGGTGALILTHPGTGQQIQVTRQTGFSNSQLISSIHNNNNYSSSTKKPIKIITIHTMAGNLTAKGCGDWFASPACNASSNYGIGGDGLIEMYLEESKSSICSSSSANDDQAVTIEVASETSSAPFKCTDKAYESLISLCADICMRNGISQLTFDPNDQQNAQHGALSKLKGNMTCHFWFANKDCPGAYLFEKLPEIATRVNTLLANAGSGGSNYGFSRSDAMIREFAYYDAKSYEKTETKSSNYLSILNYAGIMQSVLGLGQSLGGGTAVSSGGSPEGYGNGNNPNETAPPQGTTTSQPSGEEHPAQFTAYYPANDAMEGGFNDCKGFKLNPNNQTCAAPGSIPYASYVWIKDCEGKSEYNNRLYVVTDRGGAIVIDSNGRYHIDLLFPDKSSANDFGRRNGTIVVHNRNYSETKKA